MTAMRTGSLALAVVACLVGCEGWMGDTADEKGTSRQSLGFPPADEPNLYSTRVGRIQLSSEARLVDPDTFGAALAAETGRALGEPSTFETAISVASLANDVSVAGGVFVTSSEIQENTPVSGSVWLVPSTEPKLTGGGVVVVQGFTVHHVSLSFTAMWVSATTARVYAAVQDISAAASGSSVCCGPRYKGTLPGAPQPDGFGGTSCPTTPIPSAYCTPDVFLGAMENPPTPFVQFTTYRKESVQSYNMLPPLAGFAGIGGCEVMRVTCDVDPLEGNENGAAEATWPRGRICGGQSLEYGGGREIDESCIFASGWFGGVATSGRTMSYGAGSYSPGVSCDGQCPECATTTSAFNTGVLPRQCAFIRYEPGSGICDQSKDEAWVAATQQSLNDYIVATNGAFCGGLSDPKSRCSCGPADNNGRQQCVKCTDGQSCSHYARVTDRLAPAGTASPAAEPVIALADIFIDCESTPPCGGDGTARKPLVHRDAPPVPVKEAETKSTTTPTVDPIVRAERIQNGLDGKGPANQPDNKPSDATRPPALVPKAGDPVSLLDGAFTLSSVDLSFEGARRPLEFSRSYSSRSGMRGFLGSNWTHNWDMRVVALRKENLPAWVDPACAGTPNQTTCALVQAQGSVTVFTRDEGSNLFLPQAGSVNTLAANIDGTWSLRAPDGHTWSFNKDGYLTQDRDRFGNGFGLTYEDTPWGTLRKAACPEVAFKYSFGSWESNGFPWGLDTLSEGCALLRGMTGEANLPWWDPSTVVTTATFPLAAGAPAAATAARTWAVSRQADGFGTGSPFGQNALRPLTVTDDMGRQLQFRYDATTGLLSAVDGPAGTRVEYRYLSLRLVAPAEQAGLGEFLLQQVERRDAAAPSGLTATSPRGFAFQYAAQSAALMPSSVQISEVRQRYLAFYESSLNCGFHTLNPCGEKYSSGFRLARTGPMADKEAMRIYAEAADNITRVDVVTYPGAATVLVESETHYDTSPFSLNFDRVRAQRWGDASAYRPLPAPADPLGQPWTAGGVSLPLATFNYVQAGPSGADDATAAFLEAELSARYPLEELDAYTSSRAQSLGMLLPPNSAVGSAILNRLKPTVVGEYQLKTNGSFAKSCAPEALPYRRSALPGYSASYLYFDRVLTAAAQASPVAGVDLAAGLKRSRLSCEVLAAAQTEDVASNDLATTRVLSATQGTGGVPGALYDTKRVLGRRQYTADNANRICGWTRVVDRDGDTRVFGLNFQGRALVDAVRMRDGTWRIAENLYNADGNLASRRQPLPNSVAWTPSAGDTRYTYEEYVPTTGAYAVGYPLYWARRFNVLDEVTNARGGSLAEEVEGTFAGASTTGRYTRYGYEWFFNQPHVIERGSLSGATRTATSTVAFVFDYQERPLNTNGGLLEELQSWGAGFPRSGSTWDYATIDAFMLPMVFPASAVDLNGDGLFGLASNPPVAEPWKVARGLPVLTRLIVPSGAGTKTETTAVRWNPSGRPYWVKSPDGNVVTFKYYAPSVASGAIGNAGATLALGERGLLGEVWRRPRQWIDAYGPATSTCSTLGPYKYMLGAQRQLHFPGSDNYTSPS